MRARGVSIYKTLHPHRAFRRIDRRHVRTDVEHIANGDAFAREVNVATEQDNAARTVTRAL